MTNKLYVGNLPFSEDDASIKELFSEAGTVTSATVILDRETNRSKGFGFIEMSTSEEATAAIEKLNNDNKMKEEGEGDDAESGGDDDDRAKNKKTK